MTQDEKLKHREMHKPKQIYQKQQNTLAQIRVAR